MKNNMIFMSNEINPDFKIKTVNNVEVGDILKRRSDELYYTYNGAYNLENMSQVKADVVYANFFGYIVPKLRLKKFFYTEKNELKVYTLKEN